MIIMFDTGKGKREQFNKATTGTAVTLVTVVKYIKFIISCLPICDVNSSNNNV